MTGSGHTQNVLPMVMTEEYACIGHLHNKPGGGREPIVQVPN